MTHSKTSRSISALLCGTLVAVCFGTFAYAAPSTDPQLKKSNAEYEKAPTYIKADSLVVRQNDRYFEYKGNVEVLKGDLTLTAESIDGNYDDKNQIKQIVAHRNVVVQKGPDITARGDRAIYEKATDIVTLTDNPELQQEGNVLTADKIKIFLKENRSAAEGQVRMKMVKGTDAQSVNLGSITGGKAK